MKKDRNWRMWAGFLLVLTGALSSIPIFAQFPVTRDFPWANLLLFASGGGVLGAGLVRAFRQPQLFRGRFLGPIFALLSVAMVSLFVYGIFYEARRLPASGAAPRAGQKAPDFALTDQNGKSVTL